MLYPFSTVPPHLYAVLFVMWREERGRRLAPAAAPRRPSFRLSEAIFGPLLGLLVLVGACASLCSSRSSKWPSHCA